MRYQLELDIDLPRERVLELFLDPESLPKWQSSLVSHEPINWDGKYVLGAKTKQLHKMGSREVEMIETITVLDPPKNFSATYEADGVWNLIENQFIDVNGQKTHWILDSEFKCSGFMKIMTWIMPGMFKKQTRDFMQMFKEYAESHRLAAISTDDTSPLTTIDLPRPHELRGGWAALAAVYAARGWNDVSAASNYWYYHDGGGNWACLRFVEQDKALLFGHDHEYSETYFREAAEYFGEEETDLLADSPDWWADNLEPYVGGEWIGFVYGWDGQKWQRAKYDKDDGFKSVGLLEACSMNSTQALAESASDAPGLNGESPAQEAVEALVAADAHISSAMLETVVPGWDIDAGVEAAKKFLQFEI